MPHSPLEFKCGLFILSFPLISWASCSTARVRRWLSTTESYKCMELSACGVLEDFPVPWTVKNLPARIWIHLTCFFGKDQSDHICWDAGLWISVTHSLQAVFMCLLNITEFWGLWTKLSFEPGYLCTFEVVEKLSPLENKLSIGVVYRTMDECVLPHWKHEKEFILFVF